VKNRYNITLSQKSNEYHRMACREGKTSVWLDDLYMHDIQGCVLQVHVESSH
jgi:hypothetical protein